MSTQIFIFVMILGLPYRSNIFEWGWSCSLDRFSTVKKAADEKGRKVCQFFPPTTRSRIFLFSPFETIIRFQVLLLLLHTSGILFKNIISNNNSILKINIVRTLVVQTYIFILLVTGKKNTYKLIIYAQYRMT